MSLMKIYPNGTTEIEMETKTDEKLQHNDLFIQYLRESNILIIGYDETPASILYTFSVIEKEKPVSFKITHDFNIGFGLQVCDIVNMEEG